MKTGNDVGSDFVVTVKYWRWLSVSTTQNPDEQLGSIKSQSSSTHGPLATPLIHICMTDIQVVTVCCVYMHVCIGGG